MVDLFKKSVYTAIGLAVMTRDRVEEVAKRMAEDAKMSETEGRKFVDDLVKKSDETRAALEDLVNKRVEQTLKKMNICTQKELSELEKRIRKLELEWESKKDAK
ncbi:MAG: phasin family protein [Chitinispirillaceae bacterium]